VDVATELSSLVAFKLIVFSLGALVHLFLMVLILGQRRLRRLEWLLFILIAALFMWNSGNLLALNVGLFYGVGPTLLSAFSRLIPLLGFLIAAPLVVHVHAEYAGRTRSGIAGRCMVAAFYLPVIAAPWLVGRLLGHLHLDPLTVLRPDVTLLVAWMAAALVVSALLNTAYLRKLQEAPAKSFHAGLAIVEAFLALGFLWVYVLHRGPTVGLGGYTATSLMLVGVVPGVLVGYSTLRYNLLDLQVRRNLIYSLVAIFALLIYLNVIRRVSGFLEVRNILPSAVTEGLMIFLLVVLVEPVKKQINRLLHAAFVSEFEKVQRLSAEIQEFAKRSGDLESLEAFVEERVAKELGLERVELLLGASASAAQESAPPPKARTFPVHRGRGVIALLIATPITSDMSGDLFGALQLLADQLAAALELCQLIADKIQLERELAEKAKMAFLGEMAARIAHNVKNPLSSMKTLVQLLEEDASLPERARHDCRMVVAEIDRLNRNISQVLRYAKPARDTDRAVDLVAVVNRVLSLARAEADRRQVRWEFESPGDSCEVAGGEEAASDIVSNLVVNALEASPAGSSVRVRLAREAGNSLPVTLEVQDQGPGISPELKEKIFQPFFTTRPGGTGLGLAIVVRRVEEIGGAVDFVSPLESAGQGGTCFRVQFRAAS
jgi:signal transduction histidine kinase